MTAPLGAGMSADARSALERRPHSTVRPQRARHRLWQTARPMSARHREAMGKAAGSGTVA